MTNANEIKTWIAANLDNFDNIADAHAAAAENFGPSQRLRNFIAEGWLSLHWN